MFKLAQVIWNILKYFCGQAIFCWVDNRMCSGPCFERIVGYVGVFQRISHPFPHHNHFLSLQKIARNVSHPISVEIA
jgi:hypothetical protein